MVLQSSSVPKCAEKLNKFICNYLILSKYTKIMRHYGYSNFFNVILNAAKRMKNLLLDSSTTFHFVQNDSIHFIILSLLIIQLSETDVLIIWRKFFMKNEAQIHLPKILLPNLPTKHFAKLHQKNEFFHRKTLCYFLNSFN